jgi:uncharacterized SAM-binding protein YcdF (DUF218 family)
MNDQAERPAQEAGRKTRDRRIFARLRRLLQWTVNLAVALAVAVVFTPAGDWLGGRLIRADALAEADYIVVLGGHRERAVEAARLFREGWAPRVIISSHGSGADDLAEVARCYGVEPQAIILDRLPRRTRHHADSLAQVPGVDRQADRFIVVTSPFHTSRARAVLVKAGYRHLVMHSPDWQAGGRFDRLPHHWLTRACNLPEQLRELAAWGMYWLRGWV